MKKLIIALTVVVAAIATQAASVKWKINNITAYDSSTAIASASNYKILLVYSADATQSIDLSSGASVDYGADKAITTLDPSGSGGLKSLGVAVDYDYTAGSYYFAVLYNSKGTTSESAYDYYAISDVLTGNPVATSPDTPLTLQFTAASAGTPSWQSVPEPTSGLLLLLGVAGIALKRKRA